MNIYQELFTTKVLEKIWPSASQSLTTVAFDDAKAKQPNANKNEFTESYFEKTALKEFDTSIYNQLSCSKILCSYYAQIVSDEKSTISNRLSSSGSLLMNNSLKHANGLNAASQKNSLSEMASENAKKAHKHLSLNILDFCKNALSLSHF